MARQRSIRVALGLPESVCYFFLLIGTALLAWPYLEGLDFGLFKAPGLSPEKRQFLMIFGPMAFSVAMLLFIPILPLARPQQPKARTDHGSGSSRRKAVGGRGADEMDGPVAASWPSRTLRHLRHPVAIGIAVAFPTVMAIAWLISSNDQPQSPPLSVVKEQPDRPIPSPDSTATRSGNATGGGEGDAPPATNRPERSRAVEPPRPSPKGTRDVLRALRGSEPPQSVSAPEPTPAPKVMEPSSAATTVPTPTTGPDPSASLVDDKEKESATTKGNDGEAELAEAAALLQSYTAVEAGLLSHRDGFKAMCSKRSAEDQGIVLIEQIKNDVYSEWTWERHRQRHRAYVESRKDRHQDLDSYFQQTRCFRISDSCPLGGLRTMELRAARECTTREHQKAWDAALEGVRQLIADLRREH